MDRYEIILTKEEKESLIERIAVINKIQVEIKELRKMLEENIKYLNVLWTAIYRRGLIEGIIKTGYLTGEVPPILKDGKLNLEFSETFSVIVDRGKEDGKF